MFPIPFSPSQGSIELTLPLSPWHNELQVVTRVLRRVTGDLIAAREWLLSVISNLSVSKCVPKPLTLIVAHLIVTGHGDVCQLALQAAVVIANMDPSQVVKCKLSAKQSILMLGFRFIYYHHTIKLVN